MVQLPTWSLSVEEAFYLAFPLACLAFRTEARLALFWALLGAIGPVWRLAHQADEGGWLYGYLASFDGIAIGCCSALWPEWFSLRGRGAAGFGIAVAIAMTALYLIRPIAEAKTFGVSLMAFGTPNLLLVARMPATNLAVKPGLILAAIAWLGRLSYELYLFHLVVLSGMRTALPARVVAGDSKLLLLTG